MPFVQPALLYNLMCTFVGIGPSLPCSIVMFTRARSYTVVPCVVKKTHFPSALPAVASILCWSCGARLTGASLGSHVRELFMAPTPSSKGAYRVALRGTSLDYALLGETTGT